MANSIATSMSTMIIMGTLMTTPGICMVIIMITTIITTAHSSRTARQH